MVWKCGQGVTLIKDKRMINCEKYELGSML